MPVSSFYVYAYLRPWNLEPLYVGKGFGRRARLHLLYLSKNKHINLHFQRAYDKACSLNQELILVYIRENLTEDQAFEIEVALISAIGRRDLGTGPLCNRSDGGEGTKNWSEDSRRKLSEKAKIGNAGEKNPFYGKHHTEEAKQKNSLAHLGLRKNYKPPRGEDHWWAGRKHTEETKQKIGLAHKGRAKSEVTKQKLRAADCGKSVRGSYWWVTPEGETYRSIDPRSNLDRKSRGTHWWTTPEGKSYISANARNELDRPGRSMN